MVGKLTQNSQILKIVLLVFFIPVFFKSAHAQVPIKLNNTENIEESASQLNINFGNGYTWFSVNVNGGNFVLNNILSPLQPCSNNRVIGQTQFAVYNNLWLGSLISLNPTQSYKMQLCNQQTLSISGVPVLNQSVQIGAGYSWLGYLPQVCLDINDALANIQPAPQQGNRLIGQTTFSIYNNGTWVGTLTQLCPGKGYIIQLTQSSTLKYPEIPTISTKPLSNIDKFFATSGGIISSNGGNPVTEMGLVWSKSTLPSLDNYIGKTTDYSGLTEFSNQITDLTAGTTYYVRAYATNNLGTAYGDEVMFSTLSHTCGDEFTDQRDNFVYQTVQIGNQCWMKQNLNFDASGSWCYYNNQNNCAIYGRLYNWNTAMNGEAGSNTNPSGVKGLCPAGFHFTSDSEWQEMEMFLGMSSNDAYTVGSRGTDQGNKLKSTSGWNNDGNGSNSSGFTGLPGGNYPFYSLGNKGFWWTSTHYATIPAWTHALSYDNSYSDRYLAARDYGQSVRCIKNRGTVGGMSVVITTSGSSLTSTSAISGGNVVDDGNISVTSRGIVWNISENPTIQNYLGITTNGSGTGQYISNLTNLAANTTYFVKAYSINDLGISYGGQISFTTLAEMPIVTTSSVSNITSNSATVGGNVTYDGGTTITAKGIVYSVNPNPSLSNNVINAGTGTGNYSLSSSGLSPGTTYFVRAFATNSVGTAYGDELNFTTLPQLPEVTTSVISSITSSAANGGGNVTNSGGAEVTARGIAYATTQNPTTSQNHIQSGSGTGIFTSNLTGLSPGTTYFVRAYATNQVGTAYGEQVSFTTNAVLATLTTSQISSITSTSARSGGNISNTGGGTITERGIAYGLTQNPVITGNKIQSGTGAGTFISDMANLQPGTTYYVRAYAINSAGTAYGQQESFSTLIQIPTVSTNAVSSIDVTTAITGGNVQSSGGATVTERGIVYSTITNPDISDNKKTSGSGTGSYSVLLSGLNSGTTYFVKAFATNSAGTAYGTEISFTTLAGLPTVTTTNISSITGTTASSGGNVIASGGANVTERGIVYAITQNPTTSHNKIQSGSGNGIFTSDLTGLSPATTYYLRAYAINSVGTAYGVQATFATLPVLPTVLTDGYSYITPGSATISGNVTNNGGTSVTDRGFAYSTSSNPTISDNAVSAGTGTGSFSAVLNNLTTATTYYVRAYATNSVGTAYSTQISFQTLTVNIPCPGLSNFTDSRDNNTYNTVKIGSQCWMKENLKYLPAIGCNYVNNQCFDVFDYVGTDISAAKANPNYNTYGVLYNWYAAMQGASSSSANPSGVQGICPSGWHLPSNTEFDQMSDYLNYGGTSYIGGKLKSTQLWASPNTGASNESGFSALPAGWRFLTFFHALTYYTGYLTSEEYSATNPKYNLLWYNNPNFETHSEDSKYQGFSVRCVKN